MAKTTAARADDSSFASYENFADLLEESFTSSNAMEGSVVKGVVVAIENDFALIDVGLKCEGRVPMKEFRSEEPTSELQSLMRQSYAVLCLKNKKIKTHKHSHT